VTNEEAMLTIGLLVVEARERLGYNRKISADKIGLNYRTLSDVERGERLPNKSTLAAIERAYAWSEGSLLRLWENRKQLVFGNVTIEDLRVKPHEIEVPLAKASELSTEELLAELNFRVMMMSRGQQHEDIA
jgi:transcriptional regulator with XRE-family HTH domain